MAAFLIFLAVVCVFLAVVHVADARSPPHRSISIRAELALCALLVSAFAAAVVFFLRS